MMQKAFLVTIAALFLFFTSLTPVFALEIRGIESVRAKKVLDNADLEVIDAFVAQGVGEILNAADFSSISNTRSLILANSASSEPDQVQFARQFSESAKKHVGAALEKADGLTPPERSVRVVVNLLMLIDGLAAPRLIDIPLKYIDNKNSAISYWAVHCLTGPGIINKLNTPEESAAARQIVRRIESIIPTARADVLGLVASFAGSVTISDGADLLFKVADRRIASYADWSVEDELLDATILQLLTDKITKSNPDKAAAARRFAQLLSYVFQRYIKGADRLTPLQKSELVSVLVETERSCLNKLTGKSSFEIMAAIEASSANALLEEHNKLLGDATKQGQLPAEFDFDYGKDASGAVLKHPLQLPSPPSKPEEKLDSP
jgi:hypothetical protein